MVKVSKGTQYARLDWILVSHEPCGAQAASKSAAHLSDAATVQGWSEKEAKTNVVFADSKILWETKWKTRKRVMEYNFSEAHLRVRNAILPPCPSCTSACYCLEEHCVSDSAANRLALSPTSSLIIHRGT